MSALLPQARSRFAFLLISPAGLRSCLAQRNVLAVERMQRGGLCLVGLTSGCCRRVLDLNVFGSTGVFALYSGRIQASSLISIDIAESNLGSRITSFPGCRRLTELYAMVQNGDLSSEEDGRSLLGSKSRSER